MHRFPSRSWAEEFCRRLSESEEYSRAARGWEGAILFVVTDLPQGLRRELGERAGFLLDLWHGECRGVEWFDDPGEADAPYVISASYGDWVRVVKGELSPVPALLSGRLKVRGNMAMIMRYATAAIAMVKAAQKVPTVFEE